MYKDTILIDLEDEDDSIQKIIFPENCTSLPKDNSQKASISKMKNNITEHRNSILDKMIDENEESNNFNKVLIINLLCNEVDMNNLSKIPYTALQDYELVYEVFLQIFIPYFF